MYKQEQIKPYSDDGGSKGRQVERMFDSIAHSYDTLNHRLSWNIDRHWRNRAIARLRPAKPLKILDVATGTGDFAILAASKLRPARVTGVDISEGMMDIGRGKAKAAGLADAIDFRKEDCLALSFADGEFDAVVAAFGIRNFERLDQGLKEMCRVMRPGGRLCVIELTAPKGWLMKRLFGLYSHTVLPIYGRLLSRDRSAYSYLTATIEAFPEGEEMMGILSKAGFSYPTFRRMTFGICTMYEATKQ